MRQRGELPAPAFISVTLRSTAAHLAVSADPSRGTLITSARESYGIIEVKTDRFAIVACNMCMSAVLSCWKGCPAIEPLLSMTGRNKQASPSYLPANHRSASPASPTVSIHFKVGFIHSSVHVSWGCINIVIVSMYIIGCMIERRDQLCQAREERLTKASQDRAAVDLLAAVHHDEW